MKKRFFKLTLSILCFALIGLTGCSDNDKDVIDPDEGTGEIAYFTFSIDAGELDDLTKADENIGLPFEYATEGAHVLLYKVGSGEHAYTFNLDVTNIGTIGGQMEGDDVYQAKNPTQRRFVSFAKEIEKNDYYVVALLNTPTELMKLVDAKVNIKELESAVYEYNATDFTQLIGVANSRYTDGDNTDNHRFFMSNFKRGQIIEKGDLKLTPEAAQDSAVEVLVDRAVAKVRIDTTKIEVVNGTPGDYGWKADVINKKMYWIRHEAARSNGTWEIISHTNRRYIYAQDPNFDGFSQFRVPTPKVDLEDEFHYIKSVDYSDKCDWEYITENTFDPNEGFDVATRVVLKFNLIPNKFAANESYFWYRNVAIKVDEMEDYYDDPTSLDGISDLDGLRTIIEKYKDPDNSSVTHTFDDLKTNMYVGLRYYEKGVSYYSIPIRHFMEADVQSDNYGKYGVVRNNEYIIYLTKFTGPGEPDFPPPGEETLYLSTDIHIQNWFMREHDYNYEN